MPTPRTPLLLFDNVFDTIQMYPGGSLVTSATLAGTDALNVANYRRERDYWRAGVTAGNNFITSILPGTLTKSPDFLWIDRGHNLWSKTVLVQTFTSLGATIANVSLTIPALNADGTYTPGGDPTTTTMCVTDEGALYSLYNALAAGPRIDFRVSNSWDPIVTGLMVGNRMQLTGYADKMDEDAGGMKVATRESDAGWIASDKPYPYQKLDLSLSVIGDTQYDTQLRSARFWMWAKRQPAVIAMNYGIVPARAWLYQAEAQDWSFPKQRIYRKGSIRFRECGPRILA